MFTTNMEKVIEEIRAVRNHFTTKAMESDEFTNIQSDKMDRLWSIFGELNYSIELLSKEAKYLDKLLVEMDGLVQSTKTEEL